MKFDLPQELASIIKVIGVGGGGGNAVNHMHEQGIKGVDFIVCNTDRQALETSPVPVKIQLGANLTEGLGAGAMPERGKDAAQENVDEIRQLLGDRTKMVFITAGMGGGTGTGAAPVIARIAREQGVLTVGIVTSPFQWEGRRRKQQAALGIEEMRNAVDTLLVINNDRLRDLFGNLSLDNAFEHADNVLTTAARGIAEIITKTGKVNVDFEDVKTVMSSSGVAIMGMAEAEGEERSMRAAQEALASPLLNDNDIRGAKYVLLNITHGTREVLMDEISEITDHIQEAAGSSADVIWGYGKDDSLGDKVRITVIATGFKTNPAVTEAAPAQATRTVIPLDADVPTQITKPIMNPVTGVLPQAAPPVVEEPASTEPYLKVLPEEPAAEGYGGTPPTPAKEPVATTPEPQRVIEFEVEKPAPVTASATTEPPKTVHELYEEKEAEPVTPPAPPAETASPAPLRPAAETSRPVPAARPPETPRPEVVETRISQSEHQSRVEERQARIRDLAIRVRTTNGLNEVEREPAYKRRNVQLSDGPRSSDSSISRYTLSEETGENGERRVELKRNNPYLHDNVD